MSDQDRLILVGRAAGAFGVTGEVRITTYTDSPLALLNYRDLKRKDGSHALTLISGRSVKGGVVARAKEVATREDARRLRGLDLYVPRSALPPPDEDEFYLADLIGMAVVLEDGEPVGSVKAVQNFGAGDILEIAPAQPGVRAWYLPFTREAVPEVRLEDRRIVAVPPAETSDRD